MNKKEQHISNKIKQLIEEHDFDSPAADWANMSAMLDEQHTLRENNNKNDNKTIFFIFKIFIAMTTFLIVWYVLSSGYLFSPSLETRTISETLTTIEQSTNNNTAPFQKENLISLNTEDTTNHQKKDKNAKKQKPKSVVFTTTNPPLVTKKANPTPLDKSILSLPENDTTFQRELQEQLEAFALKNRKEKLYLHLDRTFFKPGEAIWFQAYVQDAYTLESSSENNLLYVEWLSPGGKILKKLTLRHENGVVAADIQTNPAIAGGLYKIKAYTSHQAKTKNFFERDIQIQKAVLPHLRMELDFQRKAYSKGDTAIAQLDLKTLADVPLVNYDFSYTASLAGENIATLTGKTDDMGRAKVSVRLPKDLDTNDGLLNVMINYQGQTESIARSIPIVLNEIDLQFFPEGGDMVAGLGGKVAFKALNEYGKAADTEGAIYNDKNELVTTFKSYHQGMGAFELTPKLGELYHAVVTKPEGITEKILLPNPLKKGYQLRMEHSKKDELKATISSTNKGTVYLVGQANNKIQWVQKIAANSTPQSLKISTQGFPMGISQWTLFDEFRVPQAERLVFLNKDKTLNVNIKTNKKKYLPREKVQMDIAVRDEAGQAVSGNFSLSVVDDKLLTFADDKQGHILSHLLLESDVTGEVEEPNFYFDEGDKYPEIDQTLALDYLLMTQGWRRFQWNEVIYNGEPYIAMEKVKSVDGNFINGKVIDAHTGEPMIGASLYIEGTNVGTFSDVDGNFSIANLGEGTHTLILSYLGFKDRTLTFSIEESDGLLAEIGLTMQEHELNEVVVVGYQNIVRSELSASIAVVSPKAARKQKRKKSRKNKNMEGLILDEVVVTEYKVPLIEQDNTTQGGVISSEDIRKLPTRNINSIAAKAVGVTSTDEGDAVNIRGSRTNATDYYIDGIRVQGNLIPESEIEAAALRQLGGVEAQFGSAAEALQGRVAGVDLRQSKTSENKIRIRGSRSYQWQTQPLYVIDGVPLARLPRNTFDKYLNVKDIKSIKVLTSEAAHAIYGDKASSGVVAVKMKRRSRKDVKAYFKSLHQEIINDVNTQIIDYKKSVQTIMPTYQNGRVSTQQLSVHRTTLVQQEQKLRQLKELLYTMAAQTDEPIYLNTYEEMSPFLNDYQNALNFKQGYYKSRQFYSPKYKANKQPIERNDFRSTIYWSPDIQLDEKGQASLSFYNSDAVTTFKTILEGVSNQGKVARQTETYFTQLPVEMRSKLPNYSLTGDHLHIPLTLSNHTDEALESELQVRMPPGFILKNPNDLKPILSPNSSQTVLLKYEIDNSAQSGDIAIVVKANGQKDELRQYIKVQSRGFPVEKVVSGQLMEETFDVHIQAPIEGSLTAKFTAYPSVVSDLVSGLDRMLKQPTGCFEQTSSKNYPNVLVLNYMNEAGIHQPETKRKAQHYLKKGYQKLLTYEVEGGGFDWYGKKPAHEALTAYGLMQFVDMKAVYPVSNQLIDRTAKWLLSRRDGEGGWESNNRTLHSWKQGSPIGNTYIAWAMAEAGYASKIKKELQTAYEAAITSQDPYLLALAANALQHTSIDEANEIIHILLTQQQVDGSFQGATQSMTGSRGKSLTIETTALTVLALLKKGESMAQVERAIQYIAAAKTFYGFGSTQATVLAMKALITYAQVKQKEQDSGVVYMSVNDGKTFSYQYNKKNYQPIIFDQLAAQLNVGRNQIKVRFEETNRALPYDFSWAYTTTLPESQAECQVALTTQLNQSKVNLGEQVRLTTQLKNTSQEPLSNPIALVGIPAGLSVQPWQLKELQEKGLFDYYELTDDYVIFYYRFFEAAEEKVIHLDLKADIPGRYAAPASSAYLYYDNEWKDWGAALEVEVVQ